MFRSLGCGHHGTSLVEAYSRANALPDLDPTTHRRRKFSSPQSSHRALGGAFVAVRGAGEQARASGLKPLRAPGVRGWGYYTYFRRCSRQGKMSKIVPTHFPVYGSVAVSVID